MAGSGGQCPLSIVHGLLGGCCGTIADSVQTNGHGAVARHRTGPWCAAVGGSVSLCTAVGLSEIPRCRS